MSRLTATLTALTAALALVLLAAPPAQACVQPPVTPPPVVVELHEVCFPIDEPTHCMIRAWITLLDYSSFAEQGGEFCACGLDDVGEIKEVLYAKLCDDQGNPVAEFGTFHPDADASAAITAFTNGTAQGFVAKLFENGIPGGQPLDLKFEVLLEGGQWIDAEDVANAILTSPSPAVVTGGWDPATMKLSHTGFVPPENEPCNGGVCPCVQTRNSYTAYVNGAEKIMARRGVDVSNAKACKKQIPFDAEQQPTGTMAYAPSR